ncbi:hypothetical protein FLCU109888_11555 [Flavobacterium cucumis]|uniref:Uncharacterized protein n=1 Tax=Flavobacterium cucumis TaxID=416016 RepID=A0A1M7ZW99_9FLAO|nr:hypothetical protein [Flavobacterium cucumis]SHO72887.1 hypothetical protein SAMN05443547_1231 [Flavobacterium cucumis]
MIGNAGVFININVEGGGGSGEVTEQVVKLSPDVDGNVFVLPEHNGKFLIIDAFPFLGANVVFPLNTYCKGINLTGQLSFSFDINEEYLVEYPNSEGFIYNPLERFQIYSYRDEASNTPKAVIHIDTNILPVSEPKP